jgi:hypothetical protein
MNRTLILGIAMLLAIVGIALVGGEKVAVAGHGCHGCCCGGDCCGGGGCCGGAAPSCGGEAAPAPAAAPAPPAPMTSIHSDRAPFAFSHVSYRR